MDLPVETIWGLIGWGALCLAVALQWLAGYLLRDRKERKPMTVTAWLRLPLTLLRLALCWPVQQCCRGPLERWRPGWNCTFCGECFWGGPLGRAARERSLFLCPVCGEEV